MVGSELYCPKVDHRQYAPRDAAAGSFDDILGRISPSSNPLVSGELFPSIYDSQCKCENCGDEFVVMVTFSRIIEGETSKSGLEVIAGDIVLK